jgi:hypothetical protein
MDQTRISCVIDTTDSACPLGMEIWVNDQKIFDQPHVKSAIDFSHSIPDQPGDHELRFVMKGKHSGHTVLDADGNISKDARLILRDMSLDGILLSQVFVDHAVYEHDYNGTGNKIQQKFYGEMGCNGTVSLKFSMPVYLWLLEHM